MLKLSSIIFIILFALLFAIGLSSCIQSIIHDKICQQNGHEKATDYYKIKTTEMLVCDYDSMYILNEEQK